jgi:predicted methyltransferase
MSDHLNPIQTYALRLIAQAPFSVVRIAGEAGWVARNDDRSLSAKFQTQTMTALERHGLVTINRGKASITARGKRFLQAEGK